MESHHHHVGWWGQAWTVDSLVSEYPIARRLLNMGVDASLSTVAAAIRNGHGNLASAAEWLMNHGHEETGAGGGRGLGVSAVARVVCSIRSQVLTHTHTCALGNDQASASGASGQRRLTRSTSPLVFADVSSPTAFSGILASGRVAMQPAGDRPRSALDLLAIADGSMNTIASAVSSNVSAGGSLPSIYARGRGDDDGDDNASTDSGGSTAIGASGALSDLLASVDAVVVEEEGEDGEDDDDEGEGAEPGQEQHGEENAQQEDATAQAASNARQHGAGDAVVAEGRRAPSSPPSPVQTAVTFSQQLSGSGRTGMPAATPITHATARGVQVATASPSDATSLASEGDSLAMGSPSSSIAELTAALPQLSPIAALGGSTAVVHVEESVSYTELRHRRRSSAAAAPTAHTSGSASVSASATARPASPGFSASSTAAVATSSRRSVLVPADTGGSGSSSRGSTMPRVAQFVEPWTDRAIEEARNSALRRAALCRILSRAPQVSVQCTPCVVGCIVDLLLPCFSIRTMLCAMP